MTTWNNNTGSHNLGDHNIGYRNNGHHNTGRYNTGDHNEGYGNTGDNNLGDYNTGNHNISSSHAGSFNTINADKAYYFNKLSSIEEWNNAAKPHWLLDVSLTTWVPSDEMSEFEKADNPDHEKTGGYLRENDIQAEYQKAWSRASAEDRAITRALPNFDIDVFHEITGIDLREGDGTLNFRRIGASNEVLIDGVVYTITKKE